MASKVKPRSQERFKLGCPQGGEPTSGAARTRSLALSENARKEVPDRSTRSIEGRCSIVYVSDTAKNFAFKCHRSNEEIFAVNSIAFHPQGTFATSGSDGIFTFWDKDNRQRLKLFNTCHCPITATAFSPDGQLFAYGVSYDWSKGHEYNNQNWPRRLFIHPVQEAEVKPKPSSSTRRR